jgi:ubiquinone/menaquinone biosynthesis C-methylase UbiE
MTQMSLLVPPRVQTDELLDEDNAPRPEMERSLRDLRRINRWLGGISIYRRLLRRFDSSASSVLDLGTGTSDLLESLDATVFRIGLDFKIEHLLYLRGVSRVARVVGDAERLPFRDDAVDVVTSAHFFHHFDDDQNVAILRDSLRVSRRGVVVNDTRRHRYPLTLISLLGRLRLVGPITAYDGPASVRRGYTAGEALSVAERVGAKRASVVKVWPYRFGILLWKRP